ncbi:MAG TPA: hypothetical protein VFW74_01080 [Acidimicrobiia bacterium]|nr:hypothetical protein [Acidimicrobiia bacterium]
MAVVFARLKLRLLRNGFRSGQRLVMFALAAIGAAWVAITAFSVLASLRPRPDEARDATVVLFGSVTLGWTILPILGFGTDETLDPQRLWLLPLSRRRLIGGLLVASLVGLAPVATLFGLSGALIALPHDALQVLFVAVGVAGTLVLGVVASRTLVTLLTPLLRSRRGRDVMIVAIALLALAPQAARFLGPGTSGTLTRRTLHDAARTLRWTPFALGGTVASESSRDHFAVALLGAVALVVLIGLLLWVWSATLERATATPDTAASPARAARRRSALALFPRYAPGLPHDRVGAVAAKDLRYLARDPRRRAALISALAFPVVLLVSVLGNGAPGATTTLFGLAAVLPASQMSLNQFGLDGEAAWVLVASGNAPAADLTGKNLANALFVLPFVAVASLVFAAVGGGWAYLPLTFLLVPAALGVVLGAGNVTSVLAPYAVPDKRNPAAASAGQGCAAGFTWIACTAVEALLLLPAAAVVVVCLRAFPLPVATVVAAVVADAYGALVWLAGRRLAARLAVGRLPELLDAVSPRHAA